VIIVAQPLTLTLAPEAGERGFYRLPLPLGQGWVEGAFPRIDAQSCYDVWRVPSFETFPEEYPSPSDRPSHRSGKLPHMFSTHWGSGQNFSHWI